MKTKNGEVLEIEQGVAGVPRMFHLEIHRACDRFLASRGIVTVSAARRNAWLFRKRK